MAELIDYDEAVDRIKKALAEVGVTALGYAPVDVDENGVGAVKVTHFYSDAAAVTQAMKISGLLDHADA